MNKIERHQILSYMGRFTLLFLTNKIISPNEKLYCNKTVLVLKFVFLGHIERIWDKMH